MNSLIAGCDETGPQLYWLDYIGTMTNMNFAAHGYASYFLWSIFDNKYKQVNYFYLIIKLLGNDIG